MALISLFFLNDLFVFQQSKRRIAHLGSGCGSLATGHAADDVRISRVGDGKRAHVKEFTAGSSQVDVVAGVVVDAGLGQHGVVLGLRLPVRRTKGKNVSFSGKTKTLA